MRTIDYASKQLNKIQNRIKSAAREAGRDAREITLVGASKKQSAELIRAFFEAGLRCVGENYLQESLDKQQALADVSLEWHFIGKIQSNKTRLLAKNFDWIQGVDRIRIARRLSTQRTAAKPLKLLIQLNIDDEQSKGGVALAEAGKLSAQISELPNLDLRGFMLIPQPRSKESEMAKTFALAREALESTNVSYGLGLNTLSMGMSGDLELAIREGSTMIRIGTDLFGPRSP